MSREEIIEMSVNLNTTDIVSSGLICAILKDHSSFISYSIPNKKDGEKYIIGIINNINIIVNPYQYYNDYKIENISGEILLDFKDYGVDYKTMAKLF